MIKSFSGHSISTAGRKPVSTLGCRGGMAGLAASSEQEAIAVQGLERDSQTEMQIPPIGRSHQA
jgi:hypothetical protein